ncbi:hypothetical protein RHGRI_005127 [Rhododendron griersonianum]|uniref:Uncharacterized protein n=1 Tax=Rhododendron griersonianum TaxID=479676 RepID=A0AAV6LBW8_9ERIC|nr:hypothetical protein RHGRI_005127 [Rhododendron griersonianum]
MPSQPPNLGVFGVVAVVWLQRSREAPTDELSDEDELLEVLESVVSSKQEPETLANIPAVSPDVGSGDSLTPHGMISPQPPEVKGVIVHSGLKLPKPPDIIDSEGKGRAAEKVPIGGHVINKSLSKAAIIDVSSSACLEFVQGLLWPDMPAVVQFNSLGQLLILLRFLRKQRYPVLLLFCYCCILLPAAAVCLGL